VLQEPNGKFGPLVQRALYKAENIVVFATKSGKLTSELAAKWFAEIFLQNSGDNSILCLDSWTGQTEKTFEKVKKGNKSYKILTIPPGSTGLIQPLGCLHFSTLEKFFEEMFGPYYPLKL